VPGKVESRHKEAKAIIDRQAEVDADVREEGGRTLRYRGQQSKLRVLRTGHLSSMNDLALANSHQWMTVRASRLSYFIPRGE
jgi:hypothetical protein